jgi:hypothetical protein
MAKGPYVTQGELKAICRYDGEIGRLVYTVRRGGILPGRTMGRINPCGHVQVEIRGVHYFEHRLVWLYHYGVFPTKELDHINRVKHDNRIENLREVTKSENQQNRDRSSIKSKSGHLGVVWVPDCKKWAARLMVNKKRMEFGKFADLNDAIRARKEAERIYHPCAPKLGEQEGGVKP